MKHLLLISIGPIQEFIASARRSRDLWYGSWMLSELSKAVAKSLHEVSGGLIFPSPTEQDALEPSSKFISPNKILAIIEGDPHSIVNDKDKGIYEIVRNRMQALWKDACGKLNGNIHDELAKEQIDDLVELYWVSIPFDDDYPKTRATAEHLMAARKVTRNFAKREGNNYPKSSLDGSRESVIPKEAYPERADSNEVKNKKIEALYKNYHAHRGEQLSGVDLLKRLGQRRDEPDFPSTSDVAAFPYVKRYNRKQGEEKTLIETLSEKIRADGGTIEGIHEGLVFENRYAECFPFQKLTPTQRQGFANLLKEHAGRVQPNPYYALVVADGDNMGAVIDAQTKVESHQLLSRVLSEFASALPEIANNNNGVLVYSGGDDVLAYLPIHTALDFARQIEFTFRDKLRDFKTQNGISPTLSVGIAVVHHLEPLSDALELARKAEKEAKSVPGKNGLAIIVSKRSGADRLIKGKFSELFERLDTLIRFSETNAISAGTAYELQNLNRDLSMTTIPVEGLTKEAMRIIERKRESGSGRNVQPEVKKALESWIAPQPISLNELALEMIIANEFADEQSKEEK